MNPLDRREFLAQSAGAVALTALLPSMALARQDLGGTPIEVAVIGIGRQGRAIIGELQKWPEVKIVALCDKDDSRLQAGLRRAQGAKGYADHGAMLSEQKALKAVFIATPTHLHVKPAIDAISAGTAVFCEAPLAHTIDDSRAIAAAARGAKAPFAVGLPARSNPVYTLARSFFRSDAVRDVVSLRAQNYRKTSMRTPASDPARDKEVNWMLDPAVSLGLAGQLGTMQFDVFHYFLGAYPTSVRGGGSVRLHNDGREVFDTIALDLAFPGGVNLMYQASLANSYDGRYEVLHGTNAAMKLAWTHGWMFKEADAPTQGWEVYANRQQFFNDEGITLIADATKLASQGKLKEGVGLPNPPLYYCIGDFLKAVATGGTPACPAEEGHRATVVGICANRAVVSGETVKIEESDLKV